MKTPATLRAIGDWLEYSPKGALLLFFGPWVAMFAGGPMMFLDPGYGNLLPTLGAIAYLPFRIFIVKRFCDASLKSRIGAVVLIFAEVLVVGLVWLVWTALFAVQFVPQ